MKKSTQKPHDERDKSPRAICVFCGSSMGNDKHYAATARRMGKLIGEHGFRMVFGAGSLGLMGETARAARDAGAPVLGILPDFLRHLEPPMQNGEKLVMTPDLFARKAKMMADADAFVILPGGLGTMDEFFEVVTSAQLRVHAKPIVAVNADGFFDPLKTLLDHLVATGFVRENMEALYHLADTPDDAITFIQRMLKARA